MASRYLKDENGDFIMRRYYVDDAEIAYFAVWIPLEEDSVDETVKKFVESKNWIWYENYFEVKYKSHKSSKDGRDIRIKTREMNKKELRKARK